MGKIENTMTLLNRDHISQKNSSYIFLEDYNYHISMMTESECIVANHIIEQFRLDFIENDEIVIVCSPKQLVDMILTSHRKF